ncbi:MAG: hypothetical protein ACLQFM_11870 [Terriglobales bacterium]
MKYLRYVALLALLAMPLSYSQAAVVVGAGIGVGVGVGPGYVAGPPACAYGYYPDYPYACAPYGYYGPSFFVSGVFIGAGPWYHGGWGHPYYGGVYGRGFGGRGYVGRGYEGHAAVVARSSESRGGFAGNRGGGFRGRR